MTGWRCVFAGGIALLALLLAPLGAGADPPPLTLSISNLGQPTAPVVVAQPQLSLAASGSCASPFSIGAEGDCPAGTWPELGWTDRDPSSTWGPVEDVAGGDTLELDFSSPVDGVRVASTSGYEPGLHDPDGVPIPNYNVIAPTSATATDQPSRWTVPVPTFDPRASNGFTFSVVARSGSDYSDYAAEIRPPRWADEVAKPCGVDAYFSTGVTSWVSCLSIGKAPPPLFQAPRISNAAYSNGRLSLTVSVPAPGVLSLDLPVGRRGRTTTISRTVAGGDGNHLKARVPRLQISRSKTIQVGMTLEGDIGSLGASQLVRVRVSKPKR